MVETEASVLKTPVTVCTPGRPADRRGPRRPVFQEQAPSESLAVLPHRDAANTSTHWQASIRSLTLSPSY
jgi:hypothetical protein